MLSGKTREPVCRRRHGATHAAWARLRCRFEEIHQLLLLLSVNGLAQEVVNLHDIADLANNSSALNCIPVSLSAGVRIRKLKFLTKGLCDN